VALHWQTSPATSASYGIGGDLAPSLVGTEIIFPDQDFLMTFSLGKISRQKFLVTFF